MAQQARASFKNITSEHHIYDELQGAPALSKMNHKREFEGDLKGSSAAEIQACMAGDQFGYVGTDRFQGELGSKKGSFVFQHGGYHTGGKLHPFGFIVPGSGTEGFKGIYGDAIITVTPDGIHTVNFRYDFEK